MVLTARETCERISGGASKPLLPAKSWSSLTTCNRLREARRQGRTVRHDGAAAGADIPAKCESVVEERTIRLISPKRPIEVPLAGTEAGHLRLAGGLLSAAAASSDKLDAAGLVDRARRLGRHAAGDL